MGRIRDSISIGASPEKVHGFAADPTIWPTWHAELERVESIEGDGSPGTTIEQVYLVGGKPRLVTSAVTEHGTTADGGYQWKCANKGALAGWESWDYIPEAAGTLVKVEIDFSIPGVPGFIGDRLIKGSLERGLNQTLQNLKARMEA